MVWVELGRLGAPYGVKGWVHVESHTERAAGLLEYPEWVLRLADGARLTRRLAAGRVHGAGLVARLEGVATRAEAARLAGARVEIERAALPPAGERRYYRVDLAGCAVRNLEGAPLGEVSHFVDAPAGPIMVIRGPDGREHWVPAAPPHLHSVDLAAQRIVVDWPAELE